MTKKKTEKSLKRKIVDYVSLSLFALFGLVLLYVAICLTLGEMPSFFGYTLLNVKTGSMEPNIPTHSVILVKSCSESDVLQLESGDIIVYSSKINSINVSITHRVVETHFSEGYVITQGDANASPDDPVFCEKIMAKFVCKLDFITVLSKALRNTWGFLFIVVLPTIALILVYVIEIAKKSIKIKLKNQGVDIDDSENESERIERIKQNAIEEFIKQNKNNDDKK